MRLVTPRSTPTTASSALDASTPATRRDLAAARRASTRRRNRPKIVALSAVAACALVAGTGFVTTGGGSAFGAAAAAATGVATGAASSVGLDIGPTLGTPTPTVTATTDGRVSVHAGSAVSEATADMTAAQAIATAKQVAQAAAGKADATALTANVTELADYKKLAPDTILARVQVTQTAAQTVAAATDAANQQIAAQQAADAAAAAAAAQAQADAAAASAKLAAGNTVAGAQATAAALASSQYGWGASQFTCLVSLWSKESGWRYTAHNSSGATGIPQALPGSKMASAGTDWASNATTQIIWGLGYIKGSYGSPCAAWAHSQSVNWY
ncbi:aggregation-promoting factor C-terminal-like domain-containing protein [Frondihabitans cladoniiphilus]|uniref:Phospholipase n=1 Tax=Frondihabitans cladoniiphilus TaxID=715785 RepID=A0ABP8VR48_9MICO